MAKYKSKFSEEFQVPQLHQYADSEDPTVSIPATIVDTNELLIE